MKNFFSILFLFLNILLNNQVICVFNCKSILSNSPIQQLKEYIFCIYNSDIRPENDRNATVVNFGLNSAQLDVDEIAHSIDFKVFVHMTWKDPHLTWKPSEYNNIQSLHVMSYEIWFPDIVMQSASNVGIDMEIPPVPCLLDHNGTILCALPTTYTTLCDTDHTWWPYDMMNCSIHIASWSHTSNEIDLRPIEYSKDDSQLLFMSLQHENMQWKVVNISLSERTMDFKFDLNFTSQSLCYQILLKRYPTMYSASYVTMAIALMSMTLIELWLEPRSTERMIVANLNFVLHLISLQDLQWKLPFNGARPPELILFYENSLVLATFSLILTSTLRYLQELNTDAPAWISSTTVSILKSRVGQVFLVSILDPKVSATIEMNADDNTNLVSLDKRESTWRYTSILIGWLAFFSVSFVYVIMLIVYIPTSRSASSFH